jgi:hypothetical protein
VGDVSLSSIPDEITGERRPGEMRETARFWGRGPRGCRRSLVAASDGVVGLTNT